ncbi:MAG: MBL fold metallo-hydrolase [Candidatus Acidiferrales bacterium]
MRLSFWGVRGSVPSPHPDTWRFGGHTPALELHAANQVVLLDAGTGLHPLGVQLQSEPPIPGLAAHLFFSHYHWAHVQGLPHFAPLAAPANNFNFFGPAPQGTAGGLRGVVETLLGAPFTSPRQGPRAGLRFEEISPASELSVGELRVRACRTNHPGGALAYRFEHDGTALVYAPVHEPGNAELDLGLRQLTRGAQLLVCDAHFLPAEQAPGSGHGTWESAVALARDAAVRNLVLFHHAPDRTDHDLEQITLSARRHFPRTWAAREGMHFDLAADTLHLWERRGRDAQRVPVPLPVLVESSHDTPPLRHEARLHNLSFHGAYFVSPLQYDVDDRLDLVLDLEAGGEAYGDPTASSLRLQGQVMRVEPLTTNGGWVGVGVRFTESRRTDASHLPGNAKATDA